MLNVGIVGLGGAWEARYRPALWKLRDRICVRCIYDSVTNRAQFAAEEFQAGVALGIHSLVARPDVRAVLFLDSGWYGHVPLHFACQHGKPVYIAAGLGDSLNSLENLQQKVAEQGIDFMPEFSRRYSPTTGRLRELMATHLGRPRQIHVRSWRPVVSGHQLTETDLLIGLLDWCQYVVGTAPCSIQSRFPAAQPACDSGPAVERQILVDFTSSATDGQVATACIDIVHGSAPPQPVAGSLNGHVIPLNWEVVCARGRARVDAAAAIQWGTNGHLDEESLSAERPDVEVMLDHFSRRVVGGLIPVPTIQDVCRNFTIVDAANQSQQLGRPVLLR